MTSFGHPFQETVTPGISFLGRPQQPDTMGMTAAEKEIAIKQYRKAKKSFTNKERLALMKSMSNKGVTALPQKSQLGSFKGDPNKMV